MASTERTVDEEALRFKFGENWLLFLRTVDAGRIDNAKGTLQTFLGRSDLTGSKFLDVGCGSGLFSLAARQLGAQVVSFDYDAQSVACTEELKRRYRPDDSLWQIAEGSVLDEQYMLNLGKFDIVYSWGVLHHTGRMWQALEHAALPVKLGGQLYVAIYNDQGGASRRWAAIKKAYNSHTGLLRRLVLMLGFFKLWTPITIADLVRGRPFSTWRNYHVERGMSPWRDVVDWVGGWPFEVAKPEQIFDFYRQRGFVLQRLKTCAGGHGCNEFAFKLCADPAAIKELAACVD